MKKVRKKISDYSSSELLQMARQAINSDATESERFKIVFGVNFSFAQLCNSLHKRKFAGRHIMTKSEFENAKRCKCSKYLSEMFIEIKDRYEDSLMTEHENREH